MAETEATTEVVTEPAGTTETAYSGQAAGQSVAPTQTTVNGTGEAGESFFDYESIKGKPELEAAYKEMQRAFGSKTQALAGSKDKIAQYDQFMSNPVDTMRQLAQQYGYQMVQGQAPAEDGKPKSYKSWEEVEKAADERADKRMMEKFGPVFGDLQKIKTQNVEQSLNNNYPDWKVYEDSMMENLKKYPELVNDHDMLYRMSVPQEVMEARATKKALAKLQGTTESGTVQGQSSTTRQTAKKPGKMTFDQAVAFARQEVRRQGLSPPRE